MYKSKQNVMCTVITVSTSIDGYIRYLWIILKHSMLPDGFRSFFFKTYTIKIPSVSRYQLQCEGGLCRGGGVTLPASAESLLGVYSF